MPQQDTSLLKDRILSIVKRRGPSLPVHGSKEKEAYDLLQKNKILKDSEQQPAIRVALRALHDFAIPFKNNEDIYWRYLTFSENDVKNIFDNKLQKEISKDTNKNIEKINISSQIQQPNKINERKKEINTEPKKEEFKENKEEHKTLKAKFESPLELKNKGKKQFKEKPIHLKKEKIKKPRKNKNSFQKTQDEKFFDRVKEYLANNNIELLDIIGLSKNKLILKVKENKEEYLVVAFNQRKITEKDIIEASKRAKEGDLDYSILSFGETSKTLQNLIEASKKLSNIR